jgi:hypothetical protein
MDTVVVTFIVCVTIVVIAWLASRVMQENYRAKAAKSRQMAQVRRGTPSRSTRERELGPWVSELIESLGHDPEELYDDEMPDELQQLINSPLVKGILQGAGGAQPGQQQQQPGPGDAWF